MGIGGLGMWEIILIFLVVLLLFGAKRLPEIGASLGKGIREFKGSVREIEREINAPDKGETLRAGSDAPETRSGEGEAPASGEAAGEEKRPEEAESSSRLTPDG